MAAFLSWFSHFSPFAPTIANCFLSEEMLKALLRGTCLSRFWHTHCPLGGASTLTTQWNCVSQIWLHHHTLPEFLHLPSLVYLWIRCCYRKTWTWKVDSKWQPYSQVLWWEACDFLRLFTQIPFSRSWWLSAVASQTSEFWSPAHSWISGWTHDRLLIQLCPLGPSLSYTHILS